MRQVGAATLLALSLLGCGGKSSSAGDDGGNGGVGGTSAGGSGTSATSAGGSGTKARDCQLDSHTYKSGESFKAQDGCNTCSCDDGEIGCTLIGCIDQCAELSASYQALLERAKFCDPQAANECRQLVAGGLTCGCETFINPNAFSRNATAELEKQFAVNGCGQDVLCGPCPPPPARGYCAANGQCADLQDLGDERACKVGGVTYSSGVSGIQDPFSCNQCSCLDGVLGCDDAACPKPCPADTKPGKGCVECGPVDNCLIVEYDCMPACVETCAQGACIDGVCVNYCG